MERRWDRAQRRRIAEAGALGLIRRVRPAVQVHVEQNVNVEPPPAPTDQLDGRGNLAGVLAARAGRN
jgi:hypothetical protein